MLNLDAQFIKKFCDYLHIVKGYAINTSSNYTIDLKNFYNYLIKNLRHIGKKHAPELNVLNLEENQVSLFLLFAKDEIILEYMAGLNKKPTTCARYLACFKSFYNYLFKYGFMENKILTRVKTKKLQSEPPKVLINEQIITLINAIDTSNPKGIRLKAILELLYSSGFRVSELISIGMDQVFLEDNLILILQGKGKKQRVVPFNHKAKESLLNYLDIRDEFLEKRARVEFLFCGNTAQGHITRQMVHGQIKELAYLCNLNPNLVFPHNIRHSCATELLKNNMDLFFIKEFLGHSSINTTEIYTHVDNQMLSDALKNHPLNNSKFFELFTKKN